MSSEVEKIKFMDDLSPLSTELFSCIAATYARQDIHANTFREIIDKLRKLQTLYSLPATVTCEDGDPVFHIDLTGENLQTLLSLDGNEEGD